MKTKREIIEDKLLALGIKPNLNGFRYLTDAVMIYSERDGRVSLTKELYPEIGKKYGKAGNSIERSIRHAIEIAVDCCDYEDMSSILGTRTSLKSGRFKSVEFIAVLALMVAREEREGK